MENVLLLFWWGREINQCEVMKCCTAILHGHTNSSAHSLKTSNIKANTNTTTISKTPKGTCQRLKQGSEVMSLQQTQALEGHNKNKNKTYIQLFH
jgi:hypothetical protein